MTVTDNDRDVLACTLWGEARGEGIAGQITVGWTIRNRNT
jgi:spore germination cell wall hydrolase CwlJ-like protein